MQIEAIVALLIKRSCELERLRTRTLATQQWAKVIATEARMEECEMIKNAIVKTVQDEKTNETTPANPAK